MRAILAALIFCLFAGFVTSADAHARHHRHHRVHHVVVVRNVAEGIGYGIGYVMTHRTHQAQFDGALPFEPGPFSQMFGAGQGVAVGAAEAVAVTVRTVADDMVGEPIRHFANDPRPGAWCGWYMRHLLGVADRSYNLARNWAHYGHAASGPGPGVIVVWPHHVGRIVGRASNGEWLVHSGNDGHAVRTRARSLAGAIAFRDP